MFPLAIAADHAGEQHDHDDHECPERHDDDSGEMLVQFHDSEERGVNLVQQQLNRIDTLRECTGQPSVATERADDSWSDHFTATGRGCAGATKARVAVRQRKGKIPRDEQGRAGRIALVLVRRASHRASLEDSLQASYALSRYKSFNNLTSRRNVNINPVNAPTTPCILFNFLSHFIVFFSVSWFALQDRRCIVTMGRGL